MTGQRRDLNQQPLSNTSGRWRKRPRPLSHTLHGPPDPTFRDVTTTLTAQTAETAETAEGAVKRAQEPTSVSVNT